MAFQRMFLSPRAIVPILIVALMALALPGTIHADVYVVRSGDTLSAIAERFGTTQAAILDANPHITSAHLIWAGAELTIPGAGDAADEPEAAAAPEASAAAPSTPVARGGVRLTHLVQPGDTLSQLAETYFTTPAAILDLNPGYTADHLIAGRVLVIVDTTGDDPSIGDRTPTTSSVAPPAAVGEPLPSSSGEPVRTGPRVGDQIVELYTVVSGDTFSGLAVRAGVSQSLLAQLNPHVNPNLLYIGETLFVPLPGDAPEVRGAPQAATPAGRYEVVPGDTATGIADRFGIPYAVLQRANTGVDLTFVYVGQELRVPGAPASQSDGQPSPGADTELTTYVVRAGDFAGEIADLHGISLDELAQLNPRLRLNFINVGQVLVVPLVDLPPPPPGTVGAGPAPQLTYTVQPGDTVSAIALQYGGTAAELALLNPGLNPNLISVGQSLFVPGTVPIPTVSRTWVSDFGDALEYVAAAAGVTPHTLLANNAGLSEGYVGPDTALRVPNREGVIVDVRTGDTLQAIAAQFGTTVQALVDAPNNGVVDPERADLGAGTAGADHDAGLRLARARRPDGRLRRVPRMGLQRAAPGDGHRAERRRDRGSGGWRGHARRRRMVLRPGLLRRDRPRQRLGQHLRTPARPGLGLRRPGARRGRPDWRGRHVGLQHRRASAPRAVSQRLVAGRAQLPALRPRPGGRMTAAGRHPLTARTSCSTCRSAARSQRPYSSDACSR